MIVRPIIFLDIDGVLNCQIFYTANQITKKNLKKQVKADKIDSDKYYESQICRERIKWLNDLCKNTNAEIVISSSWRLGSTLEDLQKIFTKMGATFDIISITPYTGYERGTEISKWLKDNITKEKHGVLYFDFDKYAIIDDDSDMLYTQRHNFFQTDNYSGLTPNTCYKIERFFNGKTFPNSNN